MSTLDFFFLAPPLIGAIRGAIKGFVQTIATILGYLTGFFFAFFYHKEILEVLDKELHLPSNYATNALVYAAIFIVPSLLFKLIGKALATSLKWLSLGFFNTILGLIAGAVKYLAIMLSIIYLIELLPFELTAEWLIMLQGKSKVFLMYLEFLHELK